jgi:hypothetical protein
LAGNSNVVEEGGSQRGKHYSICKFKRLIRKSEKEIEAESCHGDNNGGDRMGHRTVKERLLRIVICINSRNKSAYV